MSRADTPRENARATVARWVRTLAPADNNGDGDARLVCFPHSGGLAGGFRTWRGCAGAGWRLDAVQYPGRAERVRDPMLPTAAAMADAVAGELLAGHRGERLAFFGSSFGAVVGYETARRLSEWGVQIELLFVSSCGSPDRTGGGTVHRASDERFWEFVVRQGGIPRKLAEGVDLRDAVLPALRSDITVHETYVPRVGPLPRFPIRAYYSSADHLVAREDVERWGSWTTGDFSTCARPGGHFHPWTRPDGLTDDILARLRP